MALSSENPCSVSKEYYDSIMRDHLSILRRIRYHERTMSREAVHCVYRCRKEGVAMPVYLDRDEFDKRLELESLLDCADRIRSSASGLEILDKPSIMDTIRGWFQF